MSRTLLRHHVPAGLAIGGCTIFLCLIGTLIFQQDRTMEAVRSSIRHTRDLQEDVTKLDVLIRDAERGQRGYLLTGVAAYLEPYEAAVEQFPPLAEHFRQLAAGNPRQQQQVEALSSLIQQKLEELTRTIQIRIDSGQEAARKAMLNNLGQFLMARIVVLVNAVVAEQSQQLAERYAVVERVEAMTHLLTAVGSVLAVLSLALAALLLRLSAARQRTIEQDRQQRALDQAAADRARHAELTLHAEALERSNADLDDFAYIASHDLKEPLRGLFNNARFLHEDYADKLDQQGVDRISRLGFLCQRMERLINDLLYFSRLGRQELAVQPTDLNAVIHDIEIMSETTLREQNAVIVVPRELPGISCDKTRMTEVFRNLIVNAVKYNTSSTKLIEVGCRDQVLVEGGSESRVFYVKDNGLGIAEEFHEDIFRIFKRLNTEDDDKKGTGVGLTFVRKIIERHGGRIWLESVLGEGTTFYFTIAHGATRAG